MKKIVLPLLILICIIGISAEEAPDGPFKTGIDFYGGKDSEGSKESKVTAEVMARAGAVVSFDGDAAAAGEPALEIKNVLEADLSINFNLGDLNVFEAKGIYGSLSISNLFASSTITGASYSDLNHSYYNSKGYPSMSNGQVVYSEYTPSLGGMLGAAVYEAELVMGPMYVKLAGNGQAMNPTALRSGKTSIKSSFMAMDMLGGINWASGNFTAADFGMLNNVAYNHGGKGGTEYPTTGNLTFGVDLDFISGSVVVGTEALMDANSRKSSGDLSGSIPVVLDLTYKTPFKMFVSANFATAYRSSYVAENLEEDDLYLSAANKYDFGAGLKVGFRGLKAFADHSINPYVAFSLNQLDEGYEDQYTRMAAGTFNEYHLWSVGAGFEYVTGMAAYTYDVTGFNQFCGYDLLGSITRANIVDDSINFGVIYDSTGLLQAKLTGFNYNLVPNSSIGFIVEVDDILQSRVDYLSDPMGSRWAAGLYFDYNLYNKLRPFIWGKYSNNYIITYDNGITSDVREANDYANNQLRVDYGDQLELSAGVQVDLIKHLRVIASWTSGNLLRQSDTVYDLFTNENIAVPLTGVFSISAMVHL